MERRSVSPARPRNLSLQETASPSASPSPASECENKKWPDDLEEYDEISEYIKEVDEILDFLQPFPRIQEQPIHIEPPKPGLDHLENLIRLVDHLKDLKERNAQSRQRTQYLKDLKILRDQKRRLTVREDDFVPPLVEFTRKPRTSIPFQKSNRSKSLSSDDNERRIPNERYFPPRSSLAPIKAKVSKWTKVKEAFRWERAAQFDTRQKHAKSDKKIEQSRMSELPQQDSNILSTNHLQVPGDKYGETPSPADSVLSGQISSGTSTSCLLASSSGYFGEHSSVGHSCSSVHLLDLPAPPPRPLYEDDSLSLSSSGDEKVEADDATITKEAVESANIFTLTDDPESRRSKSLDSGSILAPSSHFLQHLSKESLHECSKTQKSHKTPWGKVKDIIHTKRGSIKKKVKKREEFKAEAEAFSAALDLPLTKDGPREMGPVVEITPSERTPQNSTPILPQRLESSIMRPFTPVLTLTLPSSEELQKITTVENQEGKAVWLASPEDEACRVSDSHLYDEKGKSQGLSSRWGKVKRAFLTSGSEDQLSAPSSPLQLGSFFSDIESDELSSGEWMDHDKKLELKVMKAEIQRNYSELQHKLCQELDANVAECEMLKTFPMKAGDKIKINDSDRISKKPRESLTIPLPSVDDLSPDFKKKLDEWKKIKKSATTTSASTKEEVQSHFMTRIGEWQRWRPGSHKLEASAKQEHHLHEEFYKKLEEWQMLKGTKRRSRSHSDRGKEDCEVQTPSPGLSRKNSKGTVKKASRGNSSGTDSLSGSLKEKEGRAGRKSQREKDLQWLEKELHKIEREKQRLEREREKYLEREARLEQMKRTMGSSSPTQEVLIQTATGFFRFEGISQKFTKKLYEWEKARGIAPEASTIALLETANVARKGPAREDRVGLQRSKSVGSVIDSGSIKAQSIAQHPSSLSLNDVDDLEALEQAALLDTSIASSEPGIEFKEEDEPEAIIVDVEDEVIETAAPMREPSFQTHVPVYSYAPIEVTQLIDSSGSDGERDLHVAEVTTVVRKKSEEKSNLIDQNINLLERMEVKEAICREIETDLETIQGQIVEQRDDASTPPREHLLQEGENLEHSFLEHSEQQQELAHDLVDNMYLLHAAHVSSSEPAASNVSQVLDLSSQLLSLAQKLEEALSKRNADVKNLRSSSKRHRIKGYNRTGSGKKWYSIDETSSPEYDIYPNEFPTSAEQDYAVEELPSLITKKVIELKKGLCNLRKVSETEVEEEQTDKKRRGSEENIASFTVRVADKGARSSITSIEEEMPRGRKQKRLGLRITTESSPPLPENLSPVNVTVSPPLWTKSALTRQNSQERRLEKSKAQELCSINAEEVFASNVNTTYPSFDKKNPDCIKKKIKEKISEMQRLASENRARALQKPDIVDNNDAFQDDREDDKVVIVRKRDSSEAKQKKSLKTRRITDTTIAYGFTERKTSQTDDNDDVFLKNPEKEDRSNPRDETSHILPSITPAFVFVPTRRKIISPVQTDTSSSVISYVIDEIESKESHQEEKGEDSKKEESKKKQGRSSSSSQEEATPETAERKKSIGRQAGDIGIPPLPNSPSLSRKLTPKESSPSIRMMIARYNQKISEQEISASPGGSTSPVGWRSPVLERRIKEQLERFQQDGSNALKHGGKFERREVQKSASAGLIRTSDNTKTTEPDSKNDDSAEGTNLRGILKSSSTGAMKSSTIDNCTVGTKEKICLPPPYVPEIDPSEVNGSSALRALKLKQAKAEFLSRGPSGQSWVGESSKTPTPSTSSAPFTWGYSSGASDNFSGRNRLSHVSVGSESSHDEASCGDDFPGLTKSVSAGMINLDRSDLTRRKSEGNVEQTCVKKVVGHSLTESANSTKSSSRFGLSNIKSRFRKVKMRRAKEKESAVSTLCRQSLLLDISQPVEGARVQASTSKSCPSSPVLDRSRHKGEDSKSWMKNPTRLFKSKENKQGGDVAPQKRS